MTCSVIIPVYDTPETILLRCVESVFQGNTEGTFEVILVDDGSQKETADLLDKILQTYSGIRVFHREHKGVSAARNYGTKEASGEFVFYLDSDDELMPGVLDRFADFLTEEKPDILLTDIGREKKTGRNAEEKEQIVRVIDKEVLIRYYLLMNVCALRTREEEENDHWLNRAPHGRFVKRDLALSVMFSESLHFGEDVVWNIELLNRAGKIIRCAEKTYVYHKNILSATQKERPDFPKEVRRLFASFRKMLPDFVPELDLAAVEYFTILMRVYVCAADREKRWSRFYREIRTVFWKEFFRRAKTGRLSGRYRLTAILARTRCYLGLYMLFALHHRG